MLKIKQINDAKTILRFFLLFKLSKIKYEIKMAIGIEAMNKTLVFIRFNFKAGRIEKFGIETKKVMKIKNIIFFQNLRSLSRFKFKNKAMIKKLIISRMAKMLAEKLVASFGIKDAR